MLTMPQLLQFYAPFVGLVAVVFWMGVLSNRVRTLERERVDDKKAADKANGDGDTILRSQIRLETKMERVEQDMSNISASMQNLQRQFSALGRLTSDDRPAASFKSA